MAWNAKPSGGYTINSEEGGENIHNIYVYCINNGYTLEALCGMMGNMSTESGFNPWRWEEDTYGRGRGYGLFQFTPASGYLNLGNVYGYYAPNLSTTSVTPGALPEDGEEQLRVMDNDRLSKWGGGLWRTDWDSASYPGLYADRNRIIQEWGNGKTYVSLSDFRRIKNLYDATFAFLAGYEGPLVPNMTARYNQARYIYVLLGGEDPGTDPLPPLPPTPGYSKIPLWLLFKFNGRK